MTEAVRRITYCFQMSAHESDVRNGNSGYDRPTSVNQFPFVDIFWMSNMKDFHPPDVSMWEKVNASHSVCLKQNLMW